MKIERLLAITVMLLNRRRVTARELAEHFEVSVRTVYRDVETLNGAGILPEFQGRGGNALLYSEMEKTIREAGFEHADLTQVAESAVQMRQDLINVGGKQYKNHRVYKRDL